MSSLLRARLGRSVRVWRVASVAWGGIGPLVALADLTRVVRVPGVRSTPPGTTGLP
jgi:hypothetical protein